MTEEKKTDETQRPTHLEDIDKLVLELAKAKKQVALANAEKALAQNDTAELSYKYMVLQIFMKYGLTENDKLDDAGNIFYNGAKK
jgi:hypothetical protein